jgi:hypothetical protein
MTLNAFPFGSSRYNLCISRMKHNFYQSSHDDEREISALKL